MKIMMIVSGNTGSGKSTLVRMLGNIGWNTFHTGDIIRSSNLYDTGADNPIAPDVYDSLIEGKLMDFIEYINVKPTPRMVAIECMPRKQGHVDTLQYLLENALNDWIILPVVLTCTAETATNRVKARSLSDPSNDRYNLDLRKIEEEHDIECGLLHSKICQYWEELGYTPHVCSTDDQPFSIYSTDMAPILDTMCNSLLNRYSKSGKPLRWLTRGRLVLRYISRAEEELKETVEELGDMNTGQLNTHISRVRLELIDSLAFILMALLSTGLTSDGIFSLFQNKMRIVNYRLDDDNHIDSDLTHPTGTS